MKKLKKLKSHSDKVNCVKKLNNGNIISSSDDFTIRIFDPKTYKCISVIKTENNIRDFFELPNNIDVIVTCSKNDNSIIIYKIIENKSIKLINKIEHSHESSIYKVIYLYNYNKFASCSFDSYINIWNANEPYELQHKLKNNFNLNDLIYQLSNKELLVSCSILENKICFWSLNTYQTVIVFNDISPHWVNSILEIAKDGLLIIGGYNKITVINLFTFTIKNTINSFKFGYISALSYHSSKYFIAGNEFGHVYLININNLKVIRQESINEGTINSIIMIDNEKFATGSDDNSIEIFQIFSKNL